MEFNISELNNGIRLVHKQVPGRVSHLGIMINAGSRDEEEYEQGMAHFIEHTIFKGTKKRTAKQIINRLENSGGDLDAYTTKEETCYYATFLNEDFEKALELIQDIVFNSVFPEKEIEKEKQVIIDEINSYKDSPSELIFDDFEEMVFKGHSIGRNILGTKKHLKRFRKVDIERFIKVNYNLQNIVISSVGSMNFEKVKSLVNKYFSGLSTDCEKKSRAKVKIYNPEFRSVKKNTYQSHCIIGNTAYNLKSKKRVGLILLNNILGGQSMNSRLNMELREKHGLVYSVESGYTPYSDTGIFTIYFGTDKANLEKSSDLVMRELSKLRENKLSAAQLNNAKKQIKGQIIISSESNSNLMITMAKSLLVFGNIDSTEEVCKKIDEITAEQLLEIANEIFNRDLLSKLIFS